MRKTATMVTTTIAGFLLSVLPAGADHGVGNAGNGMDLMFNLACDRAAEMVLSYNGRDPVVGSEAVQAFLNANRRELAREILRCDLQFTDALTPIDHPEAAVSCALTNVYAHEYPQGGGDENTIYLSRTTCAAQGVREDMAAQILIHEAVHHFIDRSLSNRLDGRISDEPFCNDTAGAVFRQWQWRSSFEERQWKPQPTIIDAPSRRAQHSAVWTGNDSVAGEMIVFGGCSPSDDSVVECGQYFADGGRYNPALDQWQELPSTDAPVGRTLHSAVWTGAGGNPDVANRMIIWGGCRGDDACFESLASGAMYNTETNRWQAIPDEEEDVPSARVFHSAIWALDRMLIWGGEVGYKNPAIPLQALRDGSAFFPAGYTVQDGRRLFWKKMATEGAPSQRIQHTAVWTGQQMIVWGGCDMHGAEYQLCHELKADGGRYDPVNDVWLPMSDVGAPSPRRHHSAVWTGTHMIVWGGQHRQEFLKTGALYNPATDTWQDMNWIAPTPRARHVAVWTGTKMLVWGGGFLEESVWQYPADFGEYFPDPTGEGRDHWQVQDLAAHPDVTKDLTGVWTGDRFIVWGGDNRHEVYFGRGGTYWSPR